MAQQQYKINTKQPSLPSLLILISMGTIGAVLFTPAIPQLTDFFGISDGVVKLTVTIYLLGYAIGQLFYSPLANRFGRKPALYIGISIAALGAFLCALSAPLHSFYLLLFARFIMALGASAGLTLTFTIISDFFYAAEARRLIAYATMAFAIIPGLATALGGFLVAHVAWPSCFWFLGVYNLMALGLAYRLPETAPRFDKRATRLKRVWKKYRLAFGYRRLLAYSFMIGCTTAMIYIFSATAPFIGIELLNLSPDTYGYLYLLATMAYVAGNLLAAQLAPYSSPRQVIKLGLIIMAFGALSFILCFTQAWVNVATLFLPMAGIFLGIPLLYSNSATLATMDLKDKSSASAAMSFINIGMSVVGVTVISLMPPNPLFNLPLLYCVFLIIISMLYYIARHDRQKKNIPLKHD